jgi:small-conductance mechanosensitive channel
MSDVSLHQAVFAGIDLGAGIVIGLLLRAAFRRLAARASKTSWVGDDLLLGFLSSIAFGTSVILGAWIAEPNLPLHPNVRHTVVRVLFALLIAVFTLGVAKTSARAISSVALARSGVAQSATIFVNITRATIFAVGILVLLDSLGVSIAPLLTALGVGGLAVALALQDTLSNLFAGVHILASKKVQQGDFVRLDNGQQGYIVDINWRNTIIRELPNNFVVVPNAKLASSVVTNYYRPAKEMSVLVQVGVGYDSDLEQVERVTIEVGRSVMADVDGAVRDHEPFIRYHTFGESSIDFSVILRGTEFTDQYLITHEFIKRLHRRYQAEDITIPFPIRTIVNGDLPVREDRP